MLTSVTTDEITQTVRTLVARRSSEPEVVPGAQTPLTDLGVDSLGVVALIVDLESEFALRLPAASISRETFHSVDSIATAVRALMAER
jgi:acyl carrier protein